MNRDEFLQLHTQAEVINWRRAHAEAQLQLVAGALRVEWQQVHKYVMQLAIEYERLRHEREFVLARLQTEPVDFGPPEPELVDGVETSWTEFDDPDGIDWQPVHEGVHYVRPIVLGIDYGTPPTIEVERRTRWQEFKRWLGLPPWGG